MPTRIKMKKVLEEERFADSKNLCPMSLPDKVDVAGAMYDAYEGTIDYEEDTIDDFCHEILYVYSNLYGEYLPEASFVYMVDGEIAGGIFLCDYRGEPTITYNFTKKKFQRRGIATRLLENVEKALMDLGYNELYLYLSLENTPAYNLYDRFGFSEVPLDNIEPRDLPDFSA